MSSNNVQRHNTKWLLFILPLVIAGCSDEGAERARELQTRLDEAQVHIEAQVAHSAVVERRLIAALKSSRRADQQIPVLQKTLGTRTQQLNALQKQQQAMIQVQQHLRRTLAQAYATTRQLNQHLVLASQQNKALHHHVNALDTWIRQQSAGALSQSRELEKLRTRIESTQSRRDHLHNTLALRATELVEQVKQLNQDLDQATQNTQILETRIERQQRARAYLTDKLAAANTAQKEFASKQSESVKHTAQQLEKQRMSLNERDRQHDEDQLLLKDFKAKLASLEEQSKIPDPALKDAELKLAECLSQEKKSKNAMTQLENNLTNLNQINEAYLKELQDVMAKAAACAATQAPN